LEIIREVIRRGWDPGFLPAFLRGRYEMKNLPFWEI